MGKLRSSGSGGVLGERLEEREREREREKIKEWDREIEKRERERGGLKEKIRYKKRREAGISMVKLNLYKELSDHSLEK